LSVTMSSLGNLRTIILWAFGIYEIERIIEKAE
jgi:uncharacterized protein with GYD domain